jgi:putative transposase
MRTANLSEAQIVAVSKEGKAGVPVAEIVRKHDTRRNIYANLTGRCAVATTRALQRLRELEAENTNLNRMQVDLAPQSPVIKDVLHLQL